MRKRLLVIDNYDSFTYNVVRYLEELGASPLVVKNDAASLTELEALKPAGLVISPGPCTPNDAGITLEAIKHFSLQVPVLGVCLGHQAIAQAFGAKVVRADKVMHGKTSLIRHEGGALFDGLPSSFLVTRYHSLVVEAATLPRSLRVDAWVDVCATPDIMALSHRELPVYGVQFHPESVLSEHGHALLKNFLTLHNLV